MNYKLYSGSTLSAINTDILSGDVNGYADTRGMTYVVAIVRATAAVSAGAVIAEGTNDVASIGSGAPLLMYDIAVASGSVPVGATPVVQAVSVAASVTKLFIIPVTTAFTRLRISTAFSGGTIKAASYVSDGSIPGIPMALQPVSLSPSSAASSGQAPSATTTAAGSLVLKASAGNVYHINAVAGASAGFVMLFDATTPPADGVVTPKRCWPLAANAGLELNFDGMPLRMTTGGVLVFSTTGPFTKTISATAFLAGEMA